MSVSTYDQRLMRQSAKGSDDRYRHAFEAGQHGVTWETHNGPKDPYLGDDPEEHAAWAAGHTQHRADQARAAARRAAKIGAQTGGYLARAGRSVTSTAGDIPTPSGGGTFLGILVGIAALALLYVALNHAGAVASAFTGLTSAVNWLIAPTPLPI